MRTRKVSSFFFAAAALLSGALLGSTRNADAQVYQPGQLICPAGTMPAGGWPVVIAVNGNAFGSVGASSLTDALINDIVYNRRTACGVVLGHPSITGQAAFETYVIGSIRNFVARADVAPRINRNRLGIMGFSAGGFISLTTLFRYSVGATYRVKAAGSYYGGDLAYYYGFHTLRRQSIDTRAYPVYASDKPFFATCYSASGQAKMCNQFSYDLIVAVGNNLQGWSNAKANFFSPTNAVATQPPAQPILFSACFGTLDDNVIPYTDQNALNSTLSTPNVFGRVSLYQGRHGAPHTACPNVLNDVLAAL